MKKIFVIVFGLTIFSAAQACNLNTQNCGELWNGSIQRYSMTLKANPIFMRDGLEAYKQEYQRYAQRYDNCTTFLCQNRATNAWHDYLLKTMMDYDYRLKSQGQASAKAVNDKWADQCVVAAKPNVAAYSDMSASSKVSSVSEYTGYKVSQTNGSQYVALTNSQDGKFVGWAKKSELQMQDLRNCN